MSENILRMLYPRRCPACGDVIPPDLLICAKCGSYFKKIKPPFCLMCGRHVENPDSDICFQCEGRNHSYVFGVTVFEYDAGMKRSMSDFKFNGRRDNADYYVSEAVKYRGAAIMEFAPDALVPVPIHKSKLDYRGYNQAELLADGIGAALGIKVLSDLLVRTKKTDPQKLLGKEKRALNLGNAFKCNVKKYKPELIKESFGRLMLVDDIYTTGSTIESCTRALLAAGAEEVGFISICAGKGD